MRGRCRSRVFHLGVSAILSVILNTVPFFFLPFIVNVFLALLDRAQDAIQTCHKLLGMLLESLVLVLKKVKELE